MTQPNLCNGCGQWPQNCTCESMTTQPNQNPEPAREQASEWTVLNSEEPGMCDINLGNQILRMVTDDYQMACDIADAHNRSLAAVRAELEEALERNAAQCGALDRISDALGVPHIERTTLSAFTALRNLLGILECTKAERDHLRAENERLQAGLEETESARLPL